MCNSDWIGIASILTNAVLAIWIVLVVQNRLNNRRILKDYCIQEVIDLRANYYEFISELHKGNRIKPTQIAPWFKEININGIALSKLIYKSQKIKLADKLILFHSKLRKMVDDMPEYHKNYKADNLFSLSSNSIKNLTKFKQEHSNIFNDLIIDINLK